MKAKGRIFVVGIGPGVLNHLTPEARRALEFASHWVGYRLYLEQAVSIVPSGRRYLHPFSMGGEIDRCDKALELARSGEVVALVSSGDPGIYGMAGPLLEMAEDEDIEVEVIPGLPALSAAASRLGAPLMSDFALVSLSDLLVPWEGILYRLEKASSADLVLVLYNPGSRGRRYHLAKALKVVSGWRSPDTPLGVVCRALGEGEKVFLTTLGQWTDQEFTDMSATVVVGSSRTRVVGGRMVTNRGYGCEGEGLKRPSLPSWLPVVELGEGGLSGCEIEERSLNFIHRALDPYPFSPLERRVVARAVHAVADLSVASLVRFSHEAVEQGIELLRRGARVWVDTRMALAGISREMANRLGVSVEVPTGKGEPPEGYTRSSWAFESLGERLRDSVVVVGNAPTALEVVCRAASQGMRPGLVIGVPVGFVGTVRSKTALQESGLSFFTLLGNRGGTPIAVAMMNALLRLAVGGARGGT